MEVNKMDLMSREFLQELRDAAYDAATVDADMRGWSDAYRDLARAADRLDAMHARVVSAEN
jgi:hypothetical protein